MTDFKPLDSALRDLSDRFPDLQNLPDEDPDARCNLCDGYGHIIDEEGRARACSCVRDEIIQSEYEKARIPNRYMHEDLSTFQTKTTALKDCLLKSKVYYRNYSIENYKGLYIYGPTGTGKTHLSIGILKGLISRGFDGVFYNVVDLLDAIKSTFNPTADSAPKGRLMQDLNRQIFILDDFGVQKTSTWVSDRLYSLINTRYQECKTIVITSNMSLDDLKLRGENRLASRIIDMCEQFEIKADDYRLRNTASSGGRKRSSSVR